MTVQELLELLEQIDDKSLPVFMLSEGMDPTPCTHVENSDGEGVYLFDTD